MSQTAEKASDWIRNEDPSLEALESVVQTLTLKLKAMTRAPKEDRDNVKGALEVVQKELGRIAEDNEDIEPPLTYLTPDLASLGDSADPSVKQLKGDEKRKMAEALKNSLGTGKY